MKMKNRTISCTLSPGELRKTAGEYEEGARLYSGRLHVAQGSLEAVMQGEKKTLGPFLRRLIAREEVCCSVLQFALEETADGFTVRIRGELTAAQMGVVGGILFPGATVEAA
jgi:hypothetical protein